MAQQFKAGDVVTIYERPYSHDNREGDATLLKRVAKWADGGERWTVQFPNGDKVTRVVVARE